MRWLQAALHAVGRTLKSEDDAYLGYCPPEVRQEAFSAVLEGVELGAYDTQIVNWLTGWDDPTCRTVGSLMWRCRLAGRKEGRP